MITIAFNVDDVLKDLDDVGKRQVPFAVAKALNYTAEQVQEAWKAEVAAKLQLRGNSATQFQRAIRFGAADRADKSKGKFSAEIHIVGGDVKASAPLFQRLGSMILRQDEGGARDSRATYRDPNAGMSGQVFVAGFAYPAAGLRSATANPPKALYPTNLGLQLRTFKRSKKQGGATRRGFSRLSTQARDGVSHFIMHNLRGGQGAGLFERTGPGKGQYRPLWWFDQHIQLTDRLDLEELYERIAQAELPRNFHNALISALATARP